MREITYVPESVEKYIEILGDEMRRYGVVPSCKNMVLMLYTMMSAGINILHPTDRGLEKLYQEKAFRVLRPLTQI